ncbi:unnamed protein product, partial [Ectocarpus sp. 12 AP-2014]
MTLRPLTPLPLPLPVAVPVPDCVGLSSGAGFGESLVARALMLMVRAVVGLGFGDGAGMVRGLSSFATSTFSTVAIALAAWTSTFPPLTGLSDDLAQLTLARCHIPFALPVGVKSPPPPYPSRPVALLLAATDGSRLSAARWLLRADTT